MTVPYDEIIQKGIKARQSNHRQEALRLFKEAIELVPNQFRAYREAGVECRGLGLFNDAEGFFNQALIYQPNDFATKIHQAVCNRMQGKHELCLQQIMEVINKNIINAWICNELAISLKELGRLEEAGHRFQQALAMEPNNLYILWQFALFARLLGNRPLALEQFESINQYNPLHIGAYVEAATELQALGRQREAAEKLRLAFLQSKNPVFLEKYLLALFEEDPPLAARELFANVGDHSISTVLIQNFCSYILSLPHDVGHLDAFQNNQVIAFLSQENFTVHLIVLKNRNYESFIALLSYFEPMILLLTDKSQPLINNKLFLLLIIFSAYKKNSVVMSYVMAQLEQYIALFSFSELCKVSESLVRLTSRQFALSLFSKVSISHHSIDCLLASLIMRGYYPEEACLAIFDDKDILLEILPFFCLSKNEALLKNIFTHLLQRKIFSLAEIKALYPDTEFVESLKIINETLKPVFQNSYQPVKKTEKLNVALCISGQLRGYKDAFIAINKSIIGPLQPDIFIHTWADVGFKAPFPSIHANRVFHGQFLHAYQDLLFRKNYSYNDIKKLLPTLFRLLDENTSVTQKQLKEFYQTEFVVVEDDKEGRFEKLTNQQKMRYKIDACNQLIKKTGKHYDLVIRLRPDLELHAVTPIDWRLFAENCNTRKEIFVDWSDGLGDFVEYSNGIYSIGDTVGIGSQESMDFYARALKLKDTFIDQGLAYFSKDYGHLILAHGLWLGGYAIKKMPLKKGKLINVNLKPKDVLNAVRNDLSNLDKEIADSFIKALEQDIMDQTSG
ncbi:tetratricopeptide repeat protein [Methylovulum miyakonense]|uniref:tetratricopeptide repeat protein n=1 Tax=Methylovulum miyakonense TaxID=645578 RepID=UPI00037F83AF|nr:hypothetical protein [Methylovulum miyakonense]